MRVIETFYLIDYENVNSDGLTGCDKLTKTDHIIIFFTNNAKKIDMNDIANHGGATIEMLNVPAGKQSADIHISSYLGYISGKNEGKDCSVVIISKDTDFDNVIKFWKDKTKLKISRAQQIKVSSPKASPAKQDQPKKTTPKVDSKKKTKLNQEVMQALSSADFKAVVNNKVAQLVTGLYGKERLANEVHNALKEEYSNYLEVYDTIKPLLSKYDNPTKAKTTTSATSTSQAKMEINTKIMQLLSKAGYDNDVSGYVASTVVKNIGTNKGKQQIYMTIIKKYGQKKGLAIYTHIKNHI